MIKRLHTTPTDPADVSALPDLQDLSFRVPFSHRLRFTDDVFGQDDDVLADVLTPSGRAPARVLVFLDASVAVAQSALQKQIHQFIDHHTQRVDLAGPIHLVPGGEVCKNDPAVLDDLLQAIHDARIDRQSYVLVIGGGAVLDAVGFAAGVAHRGVRLIRMPTTTLSQDDSGVGVKNGVNRFGKKNYMGCFAVPWAVINDRKLLATLPQRSWVAGFSEAVKVALLKDASLFECIESNALDIVDREPIAYDVIERSARLHADHITKGGDPFELDTARPLDFGHWSAHKLEQVTQFKLQHGEAVAIGLALDITYAEFMGYLKPADATRILTSLQALDLPTAHPALADDQVLKDGLEEFREHLGGLLTITLIHQPGQPFNVHHIDWPTMQKAIHTRLDDLK